MGNPLTTHHVDNDSLMDLDPQPDLHDGNRLVDQDALTDFVNQCCRDSLERDSWEEFRLSEMLKNGKSPNSLMTFDEFKDSWDTFRACQVLLSMRNDPGPRSDVNPENTKPSHLCSDCGRPFIRIEDLKGHAISRCKGSVCQFCSQKFSMFALLNEHLQLNPHYATTCPKCKSSHISLRALDGHLRKCKCKAKVLKCRYCEEEFESSNALELHFSAYPYHHLTCLNCKLVFSSKISYNNHIRAAKCLVADLSCGFCRDMFATKPELDSHFGSNPSHYLTCGTCKRTLSNKQGYDRNISVGKCTYNPESRVDLDNHHLICSTCKGVFTAKAGYDNHIQRVKCAVKEPDEDLDKRHLTCNTCKAAFLTRQEYEHHMERGKCTAHPIHCGSAEDDHVQSGRRRAPSKKLNAVIDGQNFDHPIVIS